MTARKPLVLVAGLFTELAAADSIPASSISGLPSAADPSASIGLSLIVGSASTFMRSDAAQPLDQSIAPTWSGLHNWAYAPVATIPTGTNILYQMNATVSAAPGTTNVFGLVQGVTLGGANNYNSIRAAQYSGVHNGTGTVTGLTGGFLTVQNANSGNVTSALCFQTTISATGAGVITGGTNLAISSPTISGGGTITTCYGVRVRQQQITGVTTGIAFGSEGATDYSYFAGGASFGQTSKPRTALDVNGPIIVKSYLCSTVPSASVAAGQFIYVSDDGGGATEAFSDGTNWLRSSDRAVVSTTNGVAGLSGASIRTAGPILTPQGRLTLTSGVPYVTTDVTGAATVYYTPALGAYCPIYDTSSTWDNTFFLELSQTLADTTKSPAATVADRLYDMFVWNDIGTVRCTRGPAWGKTSTVTITIAAPGVITWNAHGFANGTEIEFTTTGALPGGLSANTLYWVVNATTNTFQVASSGPNGTGLTTTGTQSGTHTAIGGFLTSRYTGTGTSELQLLNGLYVNKNPITNGPAAQLGTYVGTIATDSTNKLNMMFSPTPSLGGCNNRLDVWNQYNRKNVTSTNIDSTNTWTYTSATYRPKNTTDYANNIRFVVGIADDSFEATHTQIAQNSAGATMCAISICYDVGWFTSSVFTPDANAHFNWIPLTASTIWNAGSAHLKRESLIGLHRVIPLEASLTGGTTTWFGDNTITGSNVLGSSVFTLSMAM